RLRSADRPAYTTEQDRWVAALVGVLASTTDNAEAQEALSERAVGFVLLNLHGDAIGRSLLQSSLDRQTALENAGHTAHGLLWRVADTTGPGDHAADAGGSWFEHLGDLGSAAFARALWW